MLLQIIGVVFLFPDYVRFVETCIIDAIFPLLPAVFLRLLAQLQH